MRFIADGPQIPDELLVARDAGDVIFFCGAGVSVEAGLPTFEELGKRVIELLGASRSSHARLLLQKALDLGRMEGVGGLLATDKVFALLEREFEVSDIRSAVAEAVKPEAERSLRPHRILLDLATSRSGVTRLVTTNFDLLFEECAPDLRPWGPPHLPDPRNDREFRGIVHLHGRVDATYTRPEDDEFVVSSADFGRAYLSDGWATRFIQALLARFQIVFIGYTADDPPVQYLLEALKLKAGNRARLFAFQEGDHGEATALWEQRGVRAISFDHTKGYHTLWDTLAIWAKRASDLDGWYSEVLAAAATGPASLAQYQRGQVAHIMATREGARRVATSPILLDGSWLLVLDAQQRFAAPGFIDPYSEEGTEERFDPFDVLGLESDPVPKPADPTRRFETRSPPTDAWDILSTTRADTEEAADRDPAALRGDKAQFAADLPPRLASIGVWIQRVAHQPITLWWAAQQSGLHLPIRQHIERAMRQETDRFPPEIKRGWRLLFQAWDDQRPDPDLIYYEIINRVEREGWTHSLVREAAGLYRPRLVVRSGPSLIHPLSNPRKKSEWAVRPDIEYPYPHEKIVVPDEFLRPVIREFRRNLDLAIALEAEVSGDDQLYFETSRADDDGPALSETSYGLTGPIIMMQNLMARLAALDAVAARNEIAGWPTDDTQIFARLRIWAASQAVLSGEEAGALLLSLPDIVFFGSLHQRDLLYALRDRWPELSIEHRAALEQRLLTGSFPWVEEPARGAERANTYYRLGRLHWLRQAGVTFGFDIDAEIARLRTLAPEWTEEAGAEVANSHAPVVYTINTDDDSSMIEDLPLGEVLVGARAAGRLDFFDRTQREPFRGYAVKHRRRALAVLGYARRLGDVPAWAWADFLRAKGSADDPKRMMRVIVGRLLQMRLCDLLEIAYPVAEWMEAVQGRFYNDAAEFLPPLWCRLIDALASSPEESWHRSDNSWGDDALNAPVGRLVMFLMGDPITKDRVIGGGFPPEWLARLEQLLALPGDLRCQAMVMIASKLNWLHWVEPNWAERHLLPASISLSPEGDAFWDGVFWAARIPSRDLFSKIAPGLLERTQRPRSRRHHSTIMAGFLLAGWGGDENAEEPERLISDSELREILITSDDELRGQILWNLCRFVNSSVSRWPDRLISFFTHVWPKQRALRTPEISARLAECIVESDDLLPNLTALLLPRLVPIRGEPSRLASLLQNSQTNPVRRFPAAVLDLLWTILAEDPSLWPYKIEDVLDELSIDPVTMGDTRLSELRRRCDS